MNEGRDPERLILSPNLHALYNAEGIGYGMNELAQALTALVTIEHFTPAGHAKNGVHLVHNLSRARFWMFVDLARDRQLWRLTFAPQYQCTYNVTTGRFPASAPERDRWREGETVTSLSAVQTFHMHVAVGGQLYRDVHHAVTPALYTRWVAETPNLYTVRYTILARMAQVHRELAIAGKVYEDSEYEKPYDLHDYWPGGEVGRATREAAVMGAQFARWMQENKYA